MDAIRLLQHAKCARKQREYVEETGAGAEALDHRSSLCQSARQYWRSRCVPGSVRDPASAAARAAARCLCWVAVAIRQIQRSIVVLGQQCECIADAATNLSFIDGSNLQLLVNYLRSRCQTLAQQRDRAEPRHAFAGSDAVSVPVLVSSPKT